MWSKNIDESILSTKRRNFSITPTPLFSVNINNNPWAAERFHFCYSTIWEISESQQIKEAVHHVFILLKKMEIFQMICDTQDSLRALQLSHLGTLPLPPPPDPWQPPACKTSEAEDSRGPSHEGRAGNPYTLVSFASKSSTRFPQQTSEKIPLLLPAMGGEKQRFLNTLEHSVLNKIFPQEKLMGA